MKKLFFAVACVAVMLTGCKPKESTVVAPAEKPSWFTNQNYFEEKNGMYEEMPIYADNIVMVGDDYMDRGLWNEFFGDTTFKNRGITYDATEHVLYRIGRIAAQKPAKIFVSVGYNDIINGKKVDETVGRIGEIFSTAAELSPKSELYYINIAGYSEDAEESAKFEEVNSKVEALSEKGGFGYIDVRSALIEGIRSGAFSTNGGKHLNGSGYEALAQAIEGQVGKPHLNKADEKEFKGVDYYKNRASIFRSLPQTESKVVFLGNSLMNNGLWSELFPFIPIINRGISGDEIDGIRQRLDEVVRHEPTILFLITGCNDFVNNPDKPASKVWESYEKLLKEVSGQFPKTNVNVMSILPLNPKSKFYEGFNEKASEVNKLLESSAETYGYRYIDIAKVLSDENGDLKDEYTTDGIHLTADGYFKWAAELATDGSMIYIPAL